MLVYLDNVLFFLRICKLHLGYVLFYSSRLRNYY